MKIKVNVLVLLAVLALVNCEIYYNNAYRSIETNQVLVSDAPPYKEYAKMARYIVHKSDWTAFGTISSLNSIQGYPMVNIISVSDSPRGGKSTGRIYYMLTNLDFTGQDLMVSNKLTAMFSMDQDLECTRNGTDPMEPTCGRIIISGKSTEIKVTAPNFKLASEAFLSRHPAAKHWNETHHFYLCQLDIEQILVLDFYGGPHNVNVDEYYNTNMDEYDEANTVIPSVIGPKIHY